MTGRSWPVAGVDWIRPNVRCVSYRGRPTRPDGAVTPSDRERLQRALVQLEMALAMTKQLAQLRAQKYRVTWTRIVFAWGKLSKLARLFQ